MSSLDEAVPGPASVPLALRALALPVWNFESRRPRLPVRLALFLGAFWAVGRVLSFVLTPLLGGRTADALTGFVGAGGADAAVRIASTLVGTAGVAAAVALAAVVVDRRRLTDLGFRPSRTWWLDLAFGLALGAGLMTGVFAVELALGWVRVVDLVWVRAGASFLPELAAVLALFLAVGFYEELVARGYLLTNLAEGLQVGPVSARAGVALAALLSSALFGLLHAANPNATAVSTLTVSLAGLLLALGYVLTGDLAIPVGLHVTWNAFQGVVFGFPVSGVAVGARLVRVSQRGPPAWTGGTFGPEAGLLGVLALAVGALATVAWVARDRPVAVHEGVTTPALRWRNAGEGNGDD